ncbi:hypothetical protein BgiMline_002894 [Biomphalaria glabrata]|nr:hypothetical protein BgiMline_011468 [Biomphalaria glabrata]
MLLIMIGFSALVLTSTAPIANNLCLNIDNVEGSLKQVQKLLEKKTLQVNLDEIKLMELEKEIVVYKEMFELMSSSFHKYMKKTEIKVKRDIHSESLKFSEKMEHLIQSLGILAPRPHTTEIMADLQKSNHGNKLYALIAEMSRKLCHSVNQLKQSYKCVDSKNVLSSPSCEIKVSKKQKKHRLKPRAGKSDQLNVAGENITINGTIKNGNKSSSRKKVTNKDNNKISL